MQRMAESLRILIAHEKPSMLRHLHEAVAQQWQVAEACDTVQTVRQAVEARRPDVLVTGTSFPDGDGVQMVVDLGRERPLPAVIVAADGSMQRVVQAMQDHVMAYLTEPVTPETLKAAVVVARVRFEQLRELEQEVGSLRQALADRKLIERAKGILMAAERLSEEEAYSRLRSESQDRRRRIVDIAREIVDRAEQASSGAPE
jgi:response regulator NasT